MSNEITWRLENENIGRFVGTFMRFPPLSGTMVNALYNIVDRIFIGQGSGCASYLRIDFDFPDTTLYAGIWNVDRCRLERDPRSDLYLLAGYGDTGCRYRYGDLHGCRCRFRDESFYQQG